MSKFPSGNLDKLPNEILDLILQKVVEKSMKNKNETLPLRLVCKRFDVVLRPKMFQTIQLDFDRLSKTGSPLDTDQLRDVGAHVKAIVADLSPIRTQSEIKDLRAAFSSITGRIPDTKKVLEDLNMFCMGESTFDEGEFKDKLIDIFEHTPNLTKVKLHLPFKLVGQSPIHATTLLANALDCIAHRNSGNSKLDTLVIGHLSDTALIKIYGNPIDLQNAVTVFAPLKHILLGIKRQEYDNKSQASFKDGLWKLITEAKDLRSLCIMAWNSNRLTRQRASQDGGRIEREKWAAQSLPYARLVGVERFSNLVYLELKRVDLYAHVLIDILRDCGKSLQELYLNQTYLKHDQRNMPAIPYLWIGHGPDVLKASSDIWVADQIAKMRSDGTLSRLKMLRASAIGYDYINPANGGGNAFDLEDPTGMDRSFDERFVAHAMNLQSPGFTAAAIPAVNFDARATQMFHNPTSCYLQTVDGVFNTFNTQALDEINKIIGVVDASMQQLTSQLESVNKAGDGRASSPDVTMTDAEDDEEEDDDDDN